MLAVAVNAQGDQAEGVSPIPNRTAKSPERRVQILETLLGAGVWTYDARTREVTWSTGFYRLLGLDPNVINASIEFYDSLVHPDDRMSHTEIMSSAEAGDLAQRRFRMIRPDGHLVWLESRLDLQYDREGNLVMLQGVVQDVTAEERRRGESTKTSAVNGALRALVGGDLWRADTEGKLLDVGGWVKFTGQTAAQLRDYDQLSAVHPDDRSIFRRTWQEAIAQKAPLELTVRVKRHDGVYQSFMTKAVPVLGPQGALAEWIGVSWAVDELAALQKATEGIESSHLRAARALLDISAKELALRSGLSFSTMRRIEEDTNAVRPDSLSAVVAYLESRGIRFSTGENGFVTLSLLSSAGAATKL
jgi:PAS domain S-box-containing protein